MRQVRTCDFCGDDATGVYEPLPQSIPDSPRMSLCDACRDRLSAVVDPLLAATEGGHDGDPGGRTARASGDAEADAAARGADGGSGAVPDDDRATAGLGSRERPADAGDLTEGASGGELDGSTVEGPEPDARDRPAEDAREAASSPSPDSRRDEGASDEGASVDVEVSQSRDASGRTQRERGGAPRGYRKVVRFLENRQLPIDRTEAERLAAEAYELDEDEVAAAIDHAVQYGRLREISGELRR